MAAYHQHCLWGRKFGTERKRVERCLCEAKEVWVSLHYSTRIPGALEELTVEKMPHHFVHKASCLWLVMAYYDIFALPRDHVISDRLIAWSIVWTYRQVRFGTCMSGSRNMDALLDGDVWHARTHQRTHEHFRGTLRAVYANAFNTAPHSFLPLSCFFLSFFSFSLSGGYRDKCS